MDERMKRIINDYEDARNRNQFALTLQLTDISYLLQRDERLEPAYKMMMDEKWEPKFGDVTNFGIIETFYPDGSVGLIAPGSHSVVSRGLLVRIPHPLEERVKELEEDNKDLRVIILKHYKKELYKVL